MTDLTLSNASALLHRLLSAGGWQGTDAAIFEGMPHLSERLSGNDLVTTLENLEIPLTQVTCRQNEIARSDCPALFLSDDGHCLAVLDARDGELLTIAPGIDKAAWQAARRVQGRLVQIERYGTQVQPKTPASVGEIVAVMRPMLPWLCLASLMTNLMGLATPLLVMVIYDRVIPSGSLELLLSLILAVAVIALADTCFRYARTIAVAFVGRSIEQRLALALFRKLMLLPLAQLQRTSVDQQIARFRQFESLRDLFTGQVMTTVLDTPFTPIYLALLFVLAPPAAILILATIAMYCVASAVSVSIQQRRDAQAFEESARLRTLVHDAVLHQKAIADLGLRASWTARHASLTERAEVASCKAQHSQAINQSFAQSLMGLAGIGSIFYSTQAAMAGDMSFGALIAVIALVWKVLGPIQALYGSLPQILAYRRSRLQADRVLGLPEERTRGISKAHQKTLSGGVALQGVTFRPDPSRPPVLSQVSLSVAPGELVLIYGTHAAGGSGLLDLIGGLHHPTIGTVEHDGIDIRQIAVDDLRRSASYHLPNSDFFHGTILQNFRLAVPSIDEDAVRSALCQLSLETEVSAFPEGLNTRMTEAFKTSLPEGTLPALSLARTMARHAPLYLFDEPTARLDGVRRTAFRAWLKGLKGKRTVVVATPDRSFLSLADRVVYLDQGRVVVNDTGQTGLKKLNAVFARAGGI